MLDYAKMQEMFNINYYSPLFLAKGFTDKRNNKGIGSSILFISSIASFRADKGHISYAGSKSALAASAKAIAKEVSSKGIRVNCLSPAEINTPMMKALGEVFLTERTKQCPFGIGEVSDVANMAVFLLSDKAKWLTEQNYTIDCGSPA